MREPLVKPSSPWGSRALPPEMPRFTEVFSAAPCIVAPPNDGALQKHIDLRRFCAVAPALRGGWGLKQRHDNRRGRFVVVDLRDAFIVKEQALELFVTMLNVFSGAGVTGERFNKLIIFDEAHKYMGAR